MDANINDILARAREVVTVQQVFGEPIQQGGVMVVPVAAVRGGGGGGGGFDPEGKHEGGGGGFGLIARPVGAYVIRGDQVEFQPAIDVTRIVTAGTALAGLAILTLRKAIKRRR